MSILSSEDAALQAIRQHVGPAPADTAYKIKMIDLVKNTEGRCIWSGVTAAELIDLLKLRLDRGAVAGAGAGAGAAAGLHVDPQAGPGLPGALLPPLQDGRLRESLREFVEDVVEQRLGTQAGLGQSGMPQPRSASYAKCYEENGSKRQRMDSPCTPSRDEFGQAGGVSAPAFPQGVERVDADENGVLLPKVMLQLADMSGARKGHVNGREAVFYNGVAFVDTHAYRYLYDTAPDITLVRHGLGVDARTALAVLELQTKSLDNGHKGKLEHYLISLLHANPGRPFVRGALFNGQDLILYQVSRNNSLREGFTVSESPMFIMDTGEGQAGDEAWLRFWTFLLSAGTHQRRDAVDHTEGLRQQYGWAPPTLYAGDESGAGSAMQLELKGLLDVSGSVSVWEVALSSLGVAVCKQYAADRRLSSYKRELAALQAIHLHAAVGSEGSAVWPRLVSFNDEQHTLLTQPLVQSAGLMTTAALRQLFAGIRFLHVVVNHVHRDLEDKHVGRDDKGRLCVFDLSTCMPLHSETPTGYAGTVVNASEDVLEALSVGGGSAVPVRRQQDLVAVVKTVYVLIHVQRMPALRMLASRVARELAGAQGPAAHASAVGNVRRFWDREFDDANAAGRSWRELVRLAHVDALGEAAEGAYEVALQQLEEGLGCLVCPWRAESS